MPAHDTEIVICSDGRELSRRVLRPGEYVIGREQDADIRVEANLVSRRHARLRIERDDALLEDLGSSNGTFVDGQQVTGSTRIRPGQRVEVGSAIIELRRVMTAADPNVTLPPSEAVLRRLMPEEIVRGQRYEVGAQVARGGMGAILDARESAIERRVAMKVMLDPSQADDLVRFVAEAKVTGQLEHPNIVPVHELGVDENGQVFYTMKFVKGITLRKVLDLMAAGTPETIAKYPLAALLTIFQKACDAVAFAHSKRVIHRDLKPENIMLGDFGEVLVMDWGLAKVLDERRTSKPETSTPNQPMRSEVRTAAESGSTQAGTIMGTPQYMAPEQARGEVAALDARSDIYSLGAILYHILALRPSVSGSDAMEIVQKVARGEVEELVGQAPRLPAGRPVAGGAPALQRHIPDSLAAVVRKAMALRADDRYASVAELQAEITAYQGGFATSAENASLWKQGVLLVKRHKGVFTTAAAAWALITALAVWFVLNLNAERKRAERGEALAQRERDNVQAEQQRTKDALGVANDNLLRVKIQRAREAFDDGRGAEGLAWLAAVLRQDPENRFAPSWLLSALTERNFPIPAGPRITIPVAQANRSEQTSAVRFSPDGQRLLVGNRAGGLTLWNPFTGQPIGTRLSDGDLKDALWLPDGKHIVATFNGSKEAALYDVATGKQLRRTAATAHRENLARIALSPDGSLLATGDGKAGVVVWKADTLDKVTAFEPFSEEIKALEFSADNRWLAIQKGYSPREVIVWDLRTGKAAGVPFPNVNGTPAFHPSAPRLLIPAFTNMSRWRVLDLAGGDAVTAQENLTANNDAAFSPEGSRIASGSGDGRARVWDALTGAPLTPWMRHGASVWGPPQFTPDGLRLFTISSEMLCRLWDVRSGELHAEPWGMPEGALELNHCRLSPDGAHAVLATRRRNVQVWDIREGRQFPRTLKDAGSMASMALSPDGTLLATAAGPVSAKVGTARLWNFATGEKTGPDLTHTNKVQQVTFSPDGTRLATASEDRTARVWDVKTGKPLTPPLAHGGPVWKVAFSPDGRTLATGAGDKTLWLWDAATGQPLGAPISLRHTSVQRIAFSPDGALVAVANDSNGTLLYDIVGGERRAEFAGNGIHSDVVFQPDGTRLAIATENDGVLVVDAATGSVALALPHPNRVRSVRYSRDGARILSAGHDGTARLWDARTGEPLVAPMRQGSVLNGAEFSPDEARIAATLLGGGARLWDAATGQPLSEVLRTAGEAKSALFTPDGRQLAVMHSDRVTIFDVPPAPPGAAPAWLPALAEAVAGRRIDEHGEVAHAGTSDFWPIRDRLLARAGSSDHYERWAAWFLADRATRTATPWMATPLREAVQARVTMGSDGDQELGLRYDTPARLEAMTFFGRSLRERENPAPGDRSFGETLLALAPLQTLRSELARLRAEGHPAYTRDAGWRGFPARSGDIPVAVENPPREAPLVRAGGPQGDRNVAPPWIDLTAHFNMTLDSSISGSGGKGFFGPIPKGLTTLDGVGWDVRGIVALAAKMPYSSRPYPAKVGPITIGQRAERLHFLQACTWGPPADGTRVGTYVLRYADGETRELPIVYGEDLRDWSFNADRSATTKHAREAWRGDGQSSSVRLFHRAYENPRPEVEIASLDFVSAGSKAGPFLVALTVE